jgi:hypothetical protein
MKHMTAFVMLVAMVAIGCSANVQAPNVPKAPAPERIVPAAHDDGFTKAGVVFADGSRAVWDETTQAYEWSKETVEKMNQEYNTPENRQAATDAAEAAKVKTMQAYESLRNAITEAVNRDSCKCKAGDPLCNCL